jgi:hypothetical protein
MAGKVITSMWTAFMALNAFQSAGPHILSLAKGHAAAVALRDLVRVVERGQRTSRKVDGVVPKLCEGKIDLHKVGKIRLSNELYQPFEHRSPSPILLSPIT